MNWFQGLFYQKPSQNKVILNNMNLFEENLEERFYIDYKTNKVIMFENKEDYELYLKQLKFHDEFEDKLK